MSLVGQILKIAVSTCFIVRMLVSIRWIILFLVLLYCYYFYWSLLDFVLFQEFCVFELNMKMWLQYQHVSIWGLATWYKVDPLMFFLYLKLWHHLENPGQSGDVMHRQAFKIKICTFAWLESLKRIVLHMECDWKHGRKPDSCYEKGMWQNAPY